jgi:hypothetical protein
MSTLGLTGSATQGITNGTCCRTMTSVRENSTSWQAGAGLTRIQAGVLVPTDSSWDAGPFMSNESMQFRTKTTLNTLTVLGPFITDDDHQVRGQLAEPRGPDSNQVRVLRPYGREQRQRRRRLRKQERTNERIGDLNRDLIEIKDDF